jgi:hypothetical protein
VKPLHAIAEDLRRFGLILLTAGVVGGFLQEQASSGAAVYAVILGVVFNIVEYWLHHREDKS